MKNFIQIGLRQRAIYVPHVTMPVEKSPLRGTTAVLVANLARLGYGVTEPLLYALNQTSPKFQAELLAQFRDIMGINKNWTPLVKGWDTPTGETRIDHILTFFATVFQTTGTELECGHIIPPKTFPLERYNGCPFCGEPFEFGKIEKIGQGSKQKLLELWTEAELRAFFADLLRSKTALDATQMDSLKMLLAAFPIPDVSVGMKETLMAVIDSCIEYGEFEKAQALFKTPTDILRYLWYKHTGFLQIVEPKTIIKRNAKNSGHLSPRLNESALAKMTAKSDLKLKYDRKTSFMVASWLNHLPMEATKMAEIMHPKRQMWVRFIRALRLAEYSKRKGFEPLRELMDVFYTEDYAVWQGRVNRFRLRLDAENTLLLLKRRPGLFARSLFANMLWFGAETVIQAFSEVIDQVPARLVFTLNMYAPNYFNRAQNRAVKPLGGVAKTVPPNALLSLYTDEDLQAMQQMVADLCLLAIRKRFEAVETTSKTMYIAPSLFSIPVAIGDRSDNVQDIPSALMGTRFPVEGDAVRLFMQWGTGMSARHCDMDLSCNIVYAHRNEYCSFGNLVATGCKHSGDIRSIPEQVGTAEYIEINLPALRAAKAEYVSFTCNAYSTGGLTPNMVVGWMSSQHPMHISQTSGVAYDPSCVQYQVRITQPLAKGLVFGVLDVALGEVIWLEMPFGGQVVQNLSRVGIEAILEKLKSKLSIGELLTIKAEAQGLALVENEADADEAYTPTWAMNTAAVTQLLLD